MRDILLEDDPQLAAIAAVIDEVAPDVLLLTDFDYDLEGRALAAFSQRLVDPYPHHFALQPNSGRASGLDLDGDGRFGSARDAQGYGRFAGDGGMAILSRFPVQVRRVKDFSDLLWVDLPGAQLPVSSDLPEAMLAQQRLSSTGHWIVPVVLPDGEVLHLLAFSATPPVFDGLEDRNGLRNRDELRLWELVLDGQYGPPPEKFAVLGNANLDPLKGDGISDAMVDFLANPKLQDPLPGKPTADWGRDDLGALRVSYVLPDSQSIVTAAGVFWPAADDPLTALLGGEGQASGPHNLVWVDIRR